MLLYGLVTVVAGLSIFSVTRRRVAAWCGVLLFAVLPVHAEVVAAVNYREDLYAALAVFSVLAWLFWPRRGPEVLDHAVLVAAVLAIGLLAKESAVVIAPLALSCALVRTPNWTRARHWSSSRRGSLILLASVLALYTIWRASLHVAGRDDVPLVLTHRGAEERLLRTARYVVRGALDGLVPIHWSPDYAPETAPSALWFVPLFALVVAVIVLSKSRRSRPFATGIAFAMLAPLATSPLLSPINERADRYVFVATLGGAIVWGSALAWVNQASRRTPRPLRLLALLGILLPLAVLSRRAAAPWQTNRLLWTTAAARAPGSPRAWTGLSRALRLEGDLDGADRAVTRAIQLDPLFLRARVTRLYNGLSRGKVDWAKSEIVAIQALGGSRQFGMRHAETCVTLAPPEAARCAGSRSPLATPATEGRSQ